VYSSSNQTNLLLKALGVEGSCRKWLDALAQNIGERFQIPSSCGQYQTMGDILTYRTLAEGVLHPSSQQCWKHIKIAVDEDGSQMDMVIRNISKLELGEIFTAEEWELLEFFNEQIDVRIRNGKMPITNKCKPFIILPAYTGEYVGKTPALIKFVTSATENFELYTSYKGLEVMLERHMSVAGADLDRSADKDVELSK
jgi:hypothetical protein